MKLHKKEQDNTIPVYHLADGQIAIITEWDASGEYYVGRIIQRYEDILITLGEPNGAAFTTALEKLNEKLRVRVLEPGTLLEID
jgi:hypothetical protein